MERLVQKLQRIDGKSYTAYKDIAGDYFFPDFRLYIDHVQGDPFASPSRIRVRVAADRAGFPEELWNTRARQIGLEDYLARRIAGEIRKTTKGFRGTGKSGMIFIDSGGQEILQRTAVAVNREFVEARISVGLPAFGRKIAGKHALTMFTGELPKAVQNSLYYQKLPRDILHEYVFIKEDQEYIRKELLARKLVAFVANGSVLPRESGVSDLPLKGNVVPFQSPPELETEFILPNRGSVRGMGIPEGVTLIVGGGYHGKSTLLKALERGVYDHIPGDGRELTVTGETAVKIRAEDGRRVEKVDITPFINNLPHGRDTRTFSTEDASGSTSQAANIIEALEAGAGVLLLDEDTSATNFMIRDARMQELVAKDKEPITPFVDKVRQIYTELGVSTILVMGGSGDYFDVADLVIMMDEYRPADITERAREIAAAKPTERNPEGGRKFGTIKQRIPLQQSFQPQRGNKIRVDAKGLSTIVFGNTTIALAFQEQLVDASQTRAIADMILYMSKYRVDNRRTLNEIVDSVYQEIMEKGLEVLSPYFGKHPGDYAMPRKQEVLGAINRLRTLKIK